MKDFIIEYWIEALFGLITTLMGYFIRKLNKKVTEMSAIKMGVQALLRDRIIETYNHYMEKGFCPIYARESLLEMAKQYYNLGGNGIVPTLIDKIKELPTSPQNTDGSYDDFNAD